ncbi:ATP-binding protein [Nocardiopsis potens]|uniref:ATP-binding protein n=1 Tax=Nocardiopsis potens TaxID=1246458 RepID=UPI00034AA24C|nr:ATP-binding protein [Nocardiopsis potens]
MSLPEITPSFSLPRTYSTTFAGLPGQVAAARAWLDHLLARPTAPPGAARARPTACLLLSELATNTLRHTASGAPGGLFSVIATLDASHLRISVHDQGGPNTPTPPATALHHHSADQALLSCSGRGLLLVASLAAAWDTRPTPTGRTVWFELDLTADARR